METSKYSKAPSLNNFRTFSAFPSLFYLSQFSIKGESLDLSPKENNLQTEPYVTSNPEHLLDLNQKCKANTYIHYQEDKKTVLTKVSSFFTQGLVYFQDKNYELAEAMFTGVLKPFLSKHSIKNIYVNIEDMQVALLDSLFYLAKIYMIKVSDPENFAKAAGIFQYCAKFSEKYKVKTTIEEDVDFIYQAYQAERLFLGSISTEVKNDSDNAYEAYKLEIATYKADLENVRAALLENIEEIKDIGLERIGERTQKTEDIYREIETAFVNKNKQHKENNPGLIQKLLKNSFEQIGEVPCKYSIVALGSLATGKMTPWSDFEFAIIIEDTGNQEQNQQNKEYFRNLTKLLHIKVVNIGETLLRNLGIESLCNFRSPNEQDRWFWDDLTSDGFSFDGNVWYACKHPLGRQGEYIVSQEIKSEDSTIYKILTRKPDFELICTPKELSRFQREVTIESSNSASSKEDESHNWFETDKYLVQALRTVSLIYGDQTVLDSYRAELKVAANEKLVRSRALVILEEDLKTFELKLGDKEEGKLIEVKKDIYRIGERVIEALRDYFHMKVKAGEESATTWELLDRMKEEGCLSQEGAQHLNIVHPFVKPLFSNDRFF